MSLTIYICVLLAYGWFCVVVFRCFDLYLQDSSPGSVRSSRFQWIELVLVGWAFKAVQQTKLEATEKISTKKIILLVKFDKKRRNYP